MDTASSRIYTSPLRFSIDSQHSLSTHTSTTNRQARRTSPNHTHPTHPDHHSIKKSYDLESKSPLGSLPIQITISPCKYTEVVSLLFLLARAVFSITDLAIKSGIVVVATFLNRKTS